MPSRTALFVDIGVQMLQEVLREGLQSGSSYAISYTSRRFHTTIDPTALTKHSAKMQIFSSRLIFGSLLFTCRVNSRMSCGKDWATLPGVGLHAINPLCLGRGRRALEKGASSTSIRDQIPWIRKLLPYLIHPSSILLLRTHENIRRRFSTFHVLYAPFSPKPRNVRDQAPPPSVHCTNFTRRVRVNVFNHFQKR